MKRTAEQPANGHVASKRRILDDTEAQKCFRAGLFADDVRANYAKSYAASQPSVEFTVDGP